VLRVVNELYSADTSMQELFGDIGPNVEKVSDTEYKVLPPADANLDPSTWKWTSSLADNGAFYIREDAEVELPSDLAEAVEDAVPLQPAFDALDVDANVWPGPFIKMSSEDLSTISLNNTAIFGVAMPKFAEWITSGGVEEQWDDYVAQLETLGVTQNDELHQKYYDDYIASK
jgi:putative aldouronate transport system substrate-binding protein